MQLDKETMEQHEEFCEEVGNLVDIEEVRGIDRLESGKSLVAVGLAIIYAEKGSNSEAYETAKELLDDWIRFNQNQ
jgi:hypothetical protein